MAKRAAAASALLQLRARWALFLLFGVLAILASRWLLSAAWTQAAVSDAWAALTTAVFLFQLGVLWFDLPRNTSGTRGKLLPRFGPGTWISLLRVLALSMLAGFLWLPRPEGDLAWLPFGLYILFNLADLADGYAARVSGMSTALGQKLDLDLDGRGLLVATLLAYHYGVVGWVFLLVGLARYIFVFAVWLYTSAGGVFKLKPNGLRRPLAGAQMGIGTALLAPDLPMAVTFFVSTVSMIPFLGNFIFDWLTAAGYLRFKKSLARSKAWLAAFDWGLPALRVALAVLIAVRLISDMADLYFVLDIFLCLTLLLGLVGRIAAFAFLIETGFRLQGQAVQTLDFAILFLGLSLLYLGTGGITLRALKESWVFRHWGAARRS